jgi:CRP/FNR family cyclic AMP-dependent transcriptional regulator
MNSRPSKPVPAATSEAHSTTRLLQGSQLFADFPLDALNELAQQTTIRIVAEKKPVFEKGAPGNEMFAILHGRVKVSVFSEDGREVIFAILESGDFCGETALLDGQPRSATCTALEECRLVVISRATFIPFLEMHASLAIHLLSLLSQRLRGADVQMEDLTFFPLAPRLARKLVMLAEEHGDVTGSKISIDMNLSQNDLANMVAVSREAVNKQLSIWVKEGLITLAHRLIVIENNERLHEIAKLSATK